jgi:hypothetical protein
MTRRFKLPDLREPPRILEQHAMVPHLPVRFWRQEKGGGRMTADPNSLARRSAAVRRRPEWALRDKAQLGEERPASLHHMIDSPRRARRMVDQLVPRSAIRRVESKG